LNNLYRSDIYSKMEQVAWNPDAYKTNNVFSTIRMPKWSDFYDPKYLPMALKWIMDIAHDLQDSSLSKQTVNQNIAWMLVWITPLLDWAAKDPEVASSPIFKDVINFIFWNIKESNDIAKEVQERNYDKTKYWWATWYSSWYLSDNYYDDYINFKQLSSSFKSLANKYYKYYEPNYKYQWSYWSKSYYTPREYDRLESRAKSLSGLTAPRYSSSSWWWKKYDNDKPEWRWPTQKSGLARPMIKIEDPDKPKDWNANTKKRRRTRKAIKESKWGVRKTLIDWGIRRKSNGWGTQVRSLWMT